MASPFLTAHREALALQRASLAAGGGNAAFEAFLSSEEAAALQRVALLKRCEALSGDAYKEVLAKSTAGNPEAHAEVTRVVFASDMSGIDEFSARWYEVIEAKMGRMELCVDMIQRALLAQGDGSGFDAFERALVVGCAAITTPYNGYYFAYLQAVQEPWIAGKLAASPPPAEQTACYRYE